MNKYTVIINTYPRKNREEDLTRCLKSVFSQSYGSENIKVVLVENVADALDVNLVLKNANSLKKFGGKIQVVTDSTKRLSRLFNVGWQSAKTELLAFVADDVELEKNWLAEANKEILKKDETIGVITGPIISACFPAGEMHRLYLVAQKNILLKVLSWPYLYFSFENNVFAPGKMFESGVYSFGASLEESKKYPRQEIDLATTSSMVIFKSLLTKLNGFDETFNFNHADGDLFIRLKKAGYKIIFNPKVVSHHYLSLGPSRNAYFIGLDTGIFYKKHVRPKTMKGFVGLILNVLVLNLYWFYAVLKTRSLSPLKGIFGFVKGLL